MKGSRLVSIAIILTLCGGLLFFITSCSGPGAGKKAEIIPRDVLFGNPEKVSPKISPDGTRLAYIAPVDNVLNVWVKTIGQQDDKAVTKDINRGIRRYFWAEDNKHIMYLQDAGGDENWRLYGVNLETGETQDLTPF